MERYGAVAGDCAEDDVVVSYNSLTPNTYGEL